MGSYNPKTGDRGDDYEELTEAQKLKRLWEIDREQKKTRERSVSKAKKGAGDHKPLTQVEKDKRKKEILAIRDTTERLKAIQENLELFK